MPSSEGAQAVQNVALLNVAKTNPRNANIWLNLIFGLFQPLG